MAETQPTIFIVDDDPSVLRGLKFLMQSVDLRSEEFASAGEFLKADCADRPGCLLLDVQLPGLDGFELKKLLASSPCPLPIVFMTGHGDIPMGVQAMKEGAVDFLPKPVSEEVMLDAIRRALDLNEKARIEHRARAGIEERLARLSPREREVMELVVTGLLNKQVAGELGITEHTVKVHRGRVMEKMEVESLAELVIRCDRLELKEG
jgi:FixJ family two-component response regulator